MDWIQNGTLVSEQDWLSHIEALEKSCVSSTKEALRDALIATVKTLIPEEPFGVFLSGGVDSSLLTLLCKQAGAKFTCYSVGLEGCSDLPAAISVADALDVKIRTKEFSRRTKECELPELEGLFRETAACFETPDVLNIGVGAVVVAAANLAKKDGVTTFFGGLGSEEILAGYERHAKAMDVQAECWAGLKAMWSRDLVRDFALAKKLGISVLTPFLADSVILAAMGIPAERKISAVQKKIVLREIAEELGLPSVVAWRKKTAAQYGSRFDWALGRLAKNNGLTKKEYIQKLSILPKAP